MMMIARAVMMTTALSLAPLACSGSATEAPRLQSVVSPSASFAHYETFSVGLTELPPAGREQSPRSLEVQTRLRPLIVKAFERRGYVALEDGGKADLVVRFGSDTRLAEALGPGQSPENTHVVLEGAIFIDVFERSTGNQLWQGSAMAEVRPDRIDDGLLARGVEELVGRFPPRG